MFEDKDSLEDIRSEETSRGRKRPTKALTRERERRIKRIASMLSDKNCSEETYLETIDAFGLRDAPEYVKLRELWRKLRAGSS